MPPKKTASSPKKGSTGGSSSADADSDLGKLQAELLSLRRLLELKTFEAAEARQLERGWRERAELAEAALEQARVDLADIKEAILRQQTSVQDQLSQRAAALEAGSAELAAQLAASREAGAALASENAQLVAAARAADLAHQRAVQELQREFAAMLKDTLGKMHARLEAVHGESMTRTGAPPGDDDPASGDSGSKPLSASQQQPPPPSMRSSGASSAQPTPRLLLGGVAG